jgi:tripartite-type tricarboxylate transporter receptor subunit TctC
MKKGKRKWVSLVVFAVLILVGFVVPASAAEWPVRPVQVLVWAGAGGDTDLMNRTIWGVAEQQTGKTMNVSNATGAMGGLAAGKVWSARRDGHTVLGCSETMHAFGVMGASDTSSRDWDIFIIAGGSGIIGVKDDSPYKTFEDLVKASQQKPGQVTVSHCPPGCIWHIQALLAAKHGGVDWKLVPYDGSAKAVTALLTGEVDAVASSLGEQFEFIRSGRIRPLATFEKESVTISDLNLTLRPVMSVLPGAKNAPEVKQWLGTAIPADTPKDIKDQWAATLKKAFNSDKMQEVIKRRVMKPLGWMPEESKVKLFEADKVYMWVIHDLKLTSKSPEVFKVPRP